MTRLTAPPEETRREESRDDATGDGAEEGRDGEGGEGDDREESPNKGDRANQTSGSGFDEYGLPLAREPASDAELLRCPHAVVDHLLMAQCAGFAGAAFGEVRSIWR